MNCLNVLLMLCTSIYLLSIICAAQSLDRQSPADDRDRHIANLVESNSFQGPFQRHDPQGQRYIPLWTHGGDAILMQSFMRLTPDRPYTKGHVWSQRPLGVAEFSIEWKFRISGRNADGSGEYLGLWITDLKKPISGGVYGLTDKFVGIGIIVDTKRNVEDKSHRDVNIVVNNGHRTAEKILSDKVGCDANLRYWEGRDDFNVLKSSRLRIQFSNDQLIVEVDSRNIGRWRRCATISKVDLPSAWAFNSRVGLLAENEGESNNNDVLGVRVYSDPESAWAIEKFEGEDDPDEEWSLLVHHMEHEMFTVQSSLKSAIEMLESAEAAAEERITELESRLNSDIMRALEDRLRILESQVHRTLSRSIQSRVSATERAMSDRMETTLQGSMKSVSSSWRYPFYFLAGVIGAMCILFYFKYQELKKEHLL